MRALTVGVVLLVIALLSGCEKYDLDRKMEELCKQDGGNKIYETILLPSEMFDESGYPFPGWRDRSPERRLGDDYSYEHESQVIKDGNPLKGGGRLIRDHVRITRKVDHKILGESIYYIRVGGDGVVIGEPSGNLCPRSGTTIEKTVFVKK